MADAQDSATGAVDGTLQTFGTIRIWVGIVVASLVILVCILGFIGSFIFQAHYKKTEAVVTEQHCDPPITAFHCTSSRGSQTCTTQQVQNCEMHLTVTQKGGHKYTTGPFEHQYAEGQAPADESTIHVFVDPANPDDVRFSVLSPGARIGIRIACFVVAILAAISIVVNVAFRKNKNYKRLQGGIGVVDVVGGLFDGR